MQGGYGMQGANGGHGSQGCGKGSDGSKIEDLMKQIMQLLKMLEQLLGKGGLQTGKNLSFSKTPHGK